MNNIGINKCFVPFYGLSEIDNHIAMKRSFIQFLELILNLGWGGGENYSFENDFEALIFLVSGLLVKPVA